MCCKVNTDVIMANLFAKKLDNDGVSIDTLKKYFEFLKEHFPVYLASDFSEYAIEYCVKVFPQLYRSDGKGVDLVIYHGEQIPNLRFFNCKYNEVVSKYIEDTTIMFLKEYDL